nr:immunoglobulin heavy chain junction region [Mus musculus]
CARYYFGSYWYFDVW